MEPASDTSDILDRARSALAGAPPLRLAILFGSGATGRMRPDSDVDIAILPADPSLSLWQEGALAVALERALGRTVDIVRVDRAPILLQWEIVHAGRPILAAPPEAWPGLVMQVLRDHADFAPLAARAAREFLAATSAAGPDAAPRSG